MRRLPSIPTALNQLFPTPWLQRAAKDTGAFKRQRKIEVVLLFWCLMLVPQAAASLAAFQRRFRIAGGAKVARSAFLRRFSTGLVAFLGACLDRAIETTVQPPRGRPGRPGARHPQRTAAFEGKRRFDKVGYCA